jgi:hypothetical protein
MSQTPTAEQFLSLSKAASRYRYLFKELFDEVFEGVEQGKVSDAVITDLAKISVKAREMAVRASLAGEGLFALKWLEKESAFRMAKRSTRFNDDGQDWSTIFERQIRQWDASASPECRPYISAETGYLDFVSGVAEAAHRYMTGQSVREARSSVTTVAEIKLRLSEIEGLLASGTLPEGLLAHISEALQIPRAISILESEAPLLAPVSSRNDASLPARLMASELIWHFSRKFGDPLISAIYQLLGLFFEPEKQLEKRTLQRLAAEVERQAEQRADIYIEQGRLEEEQLAARAPARTQHEAFTRMANDSLRAAYERDPTIRP